MDAVWIDEIARSYPDGLSGRTDTHKNECYADVTAAALPAVANELANRRGCPLACVVALNERETAGRFTICYTFANRAAGQLLTLRMAAATDGSFPSITAEVPAAALYEREIQDLFGLTAVGHPDPRRLVLHSNWPAGQYPLRRDFAQGTKPGRAHEEIRFRRVEGDGVYEIPVGPVHAGIIEPGHFRFSVAGEPIINLEAQLYFVHKGIEKLCEGQTLERCFYIAERISGDETFANALAYCQAVEKIAGAAVPERALYGRVIFAELERLTSHLGDLAGICLDVAYGFAAFQFRMMRGWAYLIADELCGMRFLRGVNRIGGLRRDFTAGKDTSIIAQLRKIEKELGDTSDIIHANNLFIDRVETTGTLDARTAADLGAVGPGGRASGIRYDVRKAFPYAAYDRLAFTVPEHNNGDVNCRMNTKIEECFQSISLMIQAFEKMPAGAVSVEVPEVLEGGFAYGLVEAPRGESLIWLRTGEENDHGEPTVDRLKIRTASFCNWPVLCHAVKGNIVPDFPLINKSFNLSYAGNDL